MPALPGDLARFSSSMSTATAPACAIASTISTPASPADRGNALRTTSRRRERRACDDPAPGSSSVTSSRSRKGGRCGRIVSMTSAPKGTAGRPDTPVSWACPPTPSGNPVLGQRPGLRCPPRPRRLRALRLGSRQRARTVPARRTFLLERARPLTQSFSRLAWLHRDQASCGREDSHGAAQRCRMRRAPLSELTVPVTSVTSTTASYPPSHSRPSLRAPSQDTPCSPAEGSPRAAATQPSDLAPNAQVTVAGAASAKRTSRRSSRPSPFGEKTLGLAETRPSVRLTVNGILWDTSRLVAVIA